MEHTEYMLEALAEADRCGDDVPVGAVVVRDGHIIARAHNQREGFGPDAVLDHAETLAIRRAAEALGTQRLDGCILYVTLEPCPMCAGAMMLARLSQCYFGAYDARQGCCGSVYSLPHDSRFYHRVPCIGGVLEEECALRLKEFFEKKRQGSC